MLYRLIILTGPEKGRRITVTEEPMSFGRDPSCTVVLDDPDAAKRHTIIEHRRDGLLVRDLGSMNKTLVNQREIREAHCKHGDMIEIGRTRFLVQAAVEADVAGGSRDQRRKRMRATAGAMLLLVAIGAGYYLYLGDRGDEELPPPAAEEAPAPAAVAAPAVPLAPPPVTEEEIRSMRADLEDITRAVKQLAERDTKVQGTPPQPVAATVIEAPPADPVREQSERWLEDARALIAQEKYDEADALLNRVEIADPTYLPPYEERAALYERRNMLEEAISQWSRVLRQSTETPEYAQAMAERARLGQEIQKKVASSTPVVKVGDIRQRRFPATDDYDEMRIFDIGLAPVDPDAGLDDDRLYVEIWFFDTETRTGKVVPSRAVAPTGPIRPTPDASGSGERIATATYVVPKGLRSGHASDERFHGYVVRVFYNDELQDVSARPLTLVDLPAPPTGAASGGVSSVAATKDPR